MLSTISTKIVACLVMVAIISKSTDGYSCSLDYNWDSLMLTLQWPAAICRKKYCNIKPENIFTVHGLWPNKVGSYSYGNCCGDSYDPSRVFDLEPELDKFWPSVYGKSNQGFHSHEWEKHGVCARNVAKLSDQHSYFETTLELYKRLNIEQALENASIVPGDKEYSFESVRKALSSVNGNKKLRIKCAGSGRSGIGSIKEVSYCFDNNLQPTDCWQGSNCYDNVQLLSADQASGSKFVKKV